MIEHQRSWYVVDYPQSNIFSLGLHLIIIWTLKKYKKMTNLHNNNNCASQIQNHNTMICKLIGNEYQRPVCRESTRKGVQNRSEIGQRLSSKIWTKMPEDIYHDALPGSIYCGENSKIGHPCDEWIQRRLYTAIIVQSFNTYDCIIFLGKT